MPVVAFCHTQERTGPFLFDQYAEILRGSYVRGPIRFGLVLRLSPAFVSVGGGQCVEGRLDRLELRVVEVGNGERRRGDVCVWLRIIFLGFCFRFFEIRFFYLCTSCADA